MVMENDGGIPTLEWFNGYVDGKYHHDMSGNMNLD